ncbi:hypothetical protein [Symbiobacterium thermophilum]|uniref:Uncharacterized protein n=1 Tax=Symbiobacterium thermophilum TaxID=2734 RepID=A0A953I6T9_SYMTR|nr:hypothetical protein [Symbiobacterium thermophilum]MBY6275503.1 hypothetical protein [Symbiobacterium thermophilum]
MASRRNKYPWEEEQVLGQQPSPSPSTENVQSQLSRVTITPREINPEVRSLFEDLRARINQAPVTAEDVMRSPEYQNLASAIQFQAEQAQAANRRDLASRGMLRSTPAVQTMEATQSYYTAQQQALIPQLIQAEQARRQQEIANAASLLSTLSNLYNTAFSQGLQEFQATAPYNLETTAQRTQREQWERQFGLQEAQLTGRYQPEAARELLRTIVEAKQSWYDPNDGTTPEQDNARATAARNALVAMGFDADEIDRLVGPNVSLEQARANLAAVTLPTLPGRQTEQALRMGELEYQVAANPEYGLAAQAAQQMRLGELNIQDIQSRIAQRNAMPVEQRPTVDRQYIIDNYGVDPGLTTNYPAFENAMMYVIDGVNRGRSRSEIQEWLNAYSYEFRQMGVDPGALLRFASSLIARRSEQQRREQQTSTPGSTSSGRRWYGSIPE